MSNKCHGPCWAAILRAETTRFITHGQLRDDEIVNNQSGWRGCMALQQLMIPFNMEMHPADEMQGNTGLGGGGGGCGAGARVQPRRTHHFQFKQESISVHMMPNLL